ncbi:MAG TPA: hypothetical protein VFM88_05475 [Vicinamibacteria bacterium]|nr:hypothetical protein [Vicinamibacteria bacterium]
MGAPALDLVAIPGVILRFLERASIAYAATRDRHLTPHFHWVCGWIREPEPQFLTFFVAEPFTERLLRNVAECPRLALTIEHIGPHETYQFKGDFAGTRATGAAERAAFEACRERFVRDVQQIDTRHNFASRTLELYLGQPSLAVRIAVQEVFLQTPGPGAGRRLAPPEP